MHPVGPTLPGTMQTPTTRAEALKQQTKFYNTGKPCIYGHHADRYVSSRRCTICDQTRWATPAYKAKRADTWRRNRRRYRSSKDLRKYGVCRVQLFNEQKGRCALCNTSVRLGQQCHIDHCHITGKARGLLCHHCNSGLGSFKDDPRLLRAAIRYLQSRTGHVVRVVGKGRKRLGGLQTRGLLKY